jgi:hypothetical protein
MHVWTNHTDWVIAPHIDGVRTILRAHYGSDEFDDEAEEFSIVPPTEKIKINNFTGHDDAVEKTAGEWVASEGACFLCSTEY